ncbi:30S ribosomal protein S24e [Nanoarchaeota archaeon]
MNLEIVSRDKKPLLSREEVVARISYEANTPSRLEVRKELAKAAKAEEGLVVVRKIASGFGASGADVFAFIYDDEGSMKTTEGKYMINRHAEKKKKEKAPAPAPAAPVEAPADKPAEQSEAGGEEKKAEEKAEVKEEKIEEKKEEPKEEVKEEKAEEKPEEKE